MGSLWEWIYTICLMQDICVYLLMEMFSCRTKQDGLMEHPFHQKYLSQTKSTAISWNGDGTTTTEYNHLLTTAMAKVGFYVVFLANVSIINDYSYFCSTRTRQASQRCSNVRVVFFIDVWLQKIHLRKCTHHQVIWCSYFNHEGW